MSWNGWGWADERFDLDGRKEALFSFLRQSLGLKTLRETPSIGLEEVPLEPTRLEAADLEALGDLLDPERVETSRRERLFHAVGKSYWDMLRLRRGEIDGAPDAVVYPQDTEEVISVLELAQERDWAVVPYDGGSSVVGGVEVVAEGAEAVITLDTMLLSGMREFDDQAHTATFGAGTYGPDLEDALQERGYTLGHYPQSFEFSTLGGWIAARGSGQQSNRYGGPRSGSCPPRSSRPRGPGDPPAPVLVDGPRSQRHHRRQRGHVGRDHRGDGVDSPGARGARLPCVSVQGLRAQPGGRA